MTCLAQCLHYFKTLRNKTELGAPTLTLDKIYPKQIYNIQAYTYKHICTYKHNNMKNI